MKEITEIAEPGGHYEFYVDGSYRDGATGYGVVVLQNNSVVAELSGAVPTSDVDGSRQVAGELAAVKEALKWCLEHSIKEVWIFYDYFGIEKWATGKWKTNLPLTSEYARYVRACPIKIHWCKVNSHSGNHWNDRADLLAKQGAAAAISKSGPGAVSELIDIKDAWIEFLMMSGIDAQFERILNEQFARIYILTNGKTAGTFDLYNTKKKRFSPYLHNFSDEKLKLLVETLWRDYVAQNPRLR